MGIRKTKYKKTELGIEKRCNVCHDFWPLDSEFYYRQSKSKDGYGSICRACQFVKYTPKRLESAKARYIPASIRQPGQPRFVPAGGN